MLQEPKEPSMAGNSAKLRQDETQSLSTLSLCDLSELMRLKDQTFRQEKSI